MSKLVDLYNTLKKDDCNTIYLFKSGIFYIALLDDANLLSTKLNLKLSKLNENVYKCGFPCSSFDKYFQLFQLHNLNVKIIESNISYSIENYSQNISVTELLNFIANLNTDNLSVSEAYSLIENLKEKAININKICKTK